MRATEVAKNAVAAVLRPGDHAVDATVGNGWDTLFLCRQVGAEGRVTGFDVQEAALASARKRLEEAGIEPERYRLLRAGHETLAGQVRNPVGALMFNLGYLPGSEKDLITTPRTTLAALRVSLPLVREGGVITIVCYPGHEGGRDEAEAVKTWARSLGTEWRAEIGTGSSASAPFPVVVTREQG